MHFAHGEIKYGNFCNSKWQVALKLSLSIVVICLRVSLDHKTSHKGQFFEIEIYISESWINKISIDVWFVMTGQYLVEIQLFEYL